MVRNQDLLFSALAGIEEMESRNVEFMEGFNVGKRAIPNSLDSHFF
jgi:hypothetical protein